MSNLQKRFQGAIDRLVESGAETGVQVAAYRHGEPLVEAVAGLADKETGRPVTHDTLFWSASMGKGVTSTVVHVLVERGLISYDTRIAELWPEFAVHGKEKATVRHALAHMTGVPGIPLDTTPADLGDWAKMCAVIAEAEPWWEPGTKTGYHSLSYGYVIGEIVRRATGKPISQVLKEEVAGPLGVADELFFGVPEPALERVARLEQGSPEMDDAQIKQLQETAPRVLEATPPAVQPSARMANGRDYLGADIPSTGTMSARAAARMYAALLGAVDGVRLVSPDRLREITAVVVDDFDQVYGNQARLALGFALGRPIAGDTSMAFGWPGAGGAYAEADPATGTTFALTKNRFTGGDFGAATDLVKLLDD